MEFPEALNLLASGRAGEALKALQEEHSKTPSYLTMGAVGLAHLSLGNLSKAREYLDAWTKVKMPKMDSAFLWAGVVRWLEKSYVEACNIWRAGLDCDYRDAAGGIEVPLLLYFAGIRYPEISDLGEVTRLLDDRLNSWRAMHWPAPLGRFVLNRISEQEADGTARATLSTSVQFQRLAKVEFWAGVIALREHDQVSFLDRMHRCAASPESNLTHEGYLARHELGQEVTTEATRESKVSGEERKKERKKGSGVFFA